MPLRSVIFVMLKFAFDVVAKVFNCNNFQLVNFCHVPLF